MKTGSKGRNLASVADTTSETIGVFERFRVCCRLFPLLALYLRCFFIVVPYRSVDAFVVVGIRKLHKPTNIHYLQRQKGVTVSSQSAVNGDKNMMEDDKTRTIRRYSGEYESIADLFYQSVHEIGCEKYNREQLNAWATYPIDYAKWKTKCEQSLPYCCYEQEEGQGQKLAGFIEFNSTTFHIDCHYVHPKHIRRGIASHLLQHVIDIAVIKSTKEEREQEAATSQSQRRQQHERRIIQVEASHLIRPLYEKFGFICKQDNIVERNGIQLKNWIMELDLENIISPSSSQNSIPSSSSTKPRFRLGFVTDVEGHYEYF